MFLLFLCHLLPTGVGSQQISHWSVRGFLMHIVPMPIFPPRKNPMGPSWKMWSWQRNYGPRTQIQPSLVDQGLALVALHLIIPRWRN